MERSRKRIIDLSLSNGATRLRRNQSRAKQSAGAKSCWYKWLRGKGESSLPSILQALPILSRECPRGSGEESKHIKVFRFPDLSSPKDPPENALFQPPKNSPPSGMMSLFLPSSGESIINSDYCFYMLVCLSLSVCLSQFLWLIAMMANSHTQSFYGHTPTVYMYVVHQRWIRCNTPCTSSYILHADPLGRILRKKASVHDFGARRLGKDRRFKFCKCCAMSLLDGGETKF